MSKTRWIATLSIVPLLSLGACKKQETTGSGSVAAGSGAGSASATPSDIPSGSSCAAAADHLVTVFFKPEMDKLDTTDRAMGAKVLTAVTAAITTRCTEDKWADTAIRCEATATTQEALKKCTEPPGGLTSDQTDKLGAAISAAAATVPGVAEANKTYLDKSKKTEAALALNQLAKNAKAAYITSAEFPKGTAKQLPDPPCCAQPDHHCAVSTAWASDPVWKALDFQIDEPNLFQYSYQSDGQHFTATAIGDLDCDGTSITYKLEGSAKDGQPSTELTEPPPNAR